MPENLRGDFLLRVKGDSMIEAGILDGDIVVVRRAQDARNGDIVVALAGDDETADEATVKTFYKEKGRIRLQPENAALEPIYAALRADSRQSRGGLPGALSGVAPLHRTLEQELLRLAPRRVARVPGVRGVRAARGPSVRCPECEMTPARHGPMRPECR